MIYRVKDCIILAFPFPLIVAVQAQLYSDHYKNTGTDNNNNMAFSDLNHDFPFLSATSSVFGFGDEHHHHQQDQRFIGSQKIMNSSYDYHNLVSSSNSKRYVMNGLHNLGSELERQRLEMDCFLHFQNEKLKAVLNEETRKREVLMMQNYQLKMKAIIDAKDEVLNTATIRRTELQNYLSMAEKEAKNWEKKAIETEAMVMELNTKLKQARERRHEDAESVCNGGGDDDDEKESLKMACKMCQVRSSCVLLLPCRHLCCCSPCEGLLIFCPVCETVKNGSLEVVLGPN